MVHRGANLTSLEIQRYKDAYQTESKLCEYFFLSCSKLVSIANQVPNRNVMFEIYSKTGKSIEEIAKWGTGDGQNEYEVLFRKNTNFSILEIKVELNFVKILMEEK